MILNTGYEAIISGLLGVFIAQALKVLTNYVKTKKIMAYDYMNNIFYASGSETEIEEENE